MLWKTNTIRVEWREQKKHEKGEGKEGKERSRRRRRIGGRGKKTVVVAGLGQQQAPPSNLHPPLGTSLLFSFFRPTSTCFSFPFSLQMHHLLPLFFFKFRLYRPLQRIFNRDIGNIDRDDTKTDITAR